MPSPDGAGDPASPFDRRRFRPKPLGGRDHLVEIGRFARPTSPSASAADFLAGLPDFLGARALKGLAGAIAEAGRVGRRVLWGLGGHVVKVGLAPILIDLLERGFAHGFVLNGSAALHDVEVGLAGTTSEDVAGGLFDGTYGSADDTARFFAAAADRAASSGEGFGTALSRLLAERAVHPKASLLVAAARANVPVTVHVAVGTDTVHMHPACDGAALGAATHRDFLRLATLVEGLDRGVYVNVGSAVVLPEVFLKAVALAHNGLAGEAAGTRLSIVTGNLDFLRHYRPRVNVLERPAARGFDLAGHHEILLPLLRLAILDAASRGEATP